MLGIVAGGILSQSFHKQNKQISLLILIGTLLELELENEEP
jgi:hypothetical protein